MIGYLLAQALSAELPEREVVAVLTQVVVDRDDSAFLQPTKPIGPTYDEAEAHRLAASHGWHVARDGDRFRRVVPSPEPRHIVELGPVTRLLEAGAVVICAGGIPVVRVGSNLKGVDAVIDKDLTAALLAEGLDADRLVMLTDVAHVERGWGTAMSEPIRFATAGNPRQLRAGSSRDRIAQRPRGCRRRRGRNPDRAARARGGVSGQSVVLPWSCVLSPMSRVSKHA